MGFHTFDPAEADRLEDPSRFRFCSREELLQHLPQTGEVTVLDHGSGSGFYTDELAPFLGRLVGFDRQPAMHRRYQERGVPRNVGLVTGDADTLPFEAGSFDGAVSTMSFHEVATPASLAELERCLVSGGPAVFVDWSASGDGRSGPPVDERFAAREARNRLLDQGFTVRVAQERTETFLIVVEA